ncbi:site-2 protease family protein [Chondromyces apiculatus]|uniref:Peptidase M50 domain-containing protein n=1 Tax=Chondromyces apiculatus DSM 436 TaxID=1192034 RepID=A0A017T706_9BACT|nr:site-2 protease family protein [Chondromyces apiculatus]EYF05009.1 Hypothetical protein CAP_3599 [Chondromyces apiculatus DSM 436]
MPFVVLGLASVLLVVVHISVMAIAGHLLGVVVREVSYGVGPVVLARGPVRVRALPLGGSVLFKTVRDEAGKASDTAAPPDPAGALDHRPLAVQLLVMLAGSLALIALAVALRPAEGLGSVARGFAQAAAGALGPLSTAQRLLDAAFALAMTQGFVAVVGVLAAKIAALNLLPLPMLNGGQALLALLRGGRSALPRWQDVLHKVLILPSLAFGLSWMVAGAYFLVRTLRG